MKLNRLTESALLIIGGYLIIVPAVETALNLRPFQISNAVWRFGALGTISQSLMTPLLGTGILAVVLHWQRRPLGLQTLAGLALIAALLCVGGGLLFAADYLEASALVDEARRGSFVVLTAFSGGKFVLTGSALLLMAAGIWRGQPPRSRARSATDGGPGILR